MFLAACLLCTVDTGLFVYPSLSFQLLSQSCVILLTVLAVVSVPLKVLVGNRVRAFLLLWLVFLSLHGTLVPSEHYRLCYLMSGLLLALSVSVLTETGLLGRKMVCGGLLLMASVHLAMMCLQTFRLADSGNVYFPVTGAHENPTVTAIFLTGCVPVLIEGQGRNRFFRLLLLTVVVAILCLKCRTAYMGLLAIAGIYAVPVARKKMWRSISRLCRALLVTASLAAAVTAALFLYHQKQQSADGRLLIWKLSSRMISDHPMGQGFGLFEKHYNLRQADYFLNGRHTIDEVMTADHVFMPYNDFLEAGVESGVTGMFFLLAFYVMMSYRAAMMRSRMLLSVSVSFLLMSQTNFISDGIQPWFLLMCLSGTMSADRHADMPPKFHGPSVVFVLLLLPLATWHVKAVAGQLRLAQVSREVSRGLPRSHAVLQGLEPYVSTSEHYWKTRARNSILHQDWPEADRCLVRASAFSSEPDVFYNRYGCNMRMGRSGIAVRQLQTVCGILPHQLQPRYMLMRHYANCGDTVHAVAYAREIADLPLKVHVRRGENMKAEAAKLIEDSRHISGTKQE